MTRAIDSGRPRPPAAAPVAGAERIDSLDTIRGVAILGILPMNALALGLDHAAYFNVSADGIGQPFDWVIGVLTMVFVDQKMMALFSLLFGVGVVIFADRAAARGRRVVLLSEPISSSRWACSAAKPEVRTFTNDEGNRTDLDHQCVAVVVDDADLESEIERDGEFDIAPSDENATGSTPNRLVTRSRSRSSLVASAAGEPSSDVAVTEALAQRGRYAGVDKPPIRLDTRIPSGSAPQ